MTNKEALSNEKAIKILQTAHLGKSWLVKEACEMAIKALEEQKTGHWILHTDGLNEYYECSECGKTSNDCSDYCPKCGAKMIEEE